MDFTDITAALCERYPQWSERIRLLDLREAVGVRPVDNDGRIIYYNERLMRYYTPESRLFYIAQQLVHLQLHHTARGRDKDPRAWKKAADAVVNAMLKDDGFEVPEDAYLRPDAAEESAEALYETILAEGEAAAESEESELPLAVPDAPDPRSKKAGKETLAQERAIDDPGLAAIIAGLAEMLEPTMDLDFDWFPGDTIRHGVLGYRFRPYPVARAEILMDTSASVAEELLRAFVRGVKALLQEDAVVRVGCFDTRFYGWQDIHTEEDIDKLELRGSGGTDFNVAVSAFTGDAENQIIFTDGYAEMPQQHCDAVWVVYSSSPIYPKGGRVLYVKPKEEKEKYEIEFLIT